MENEGTNKLFFIEKINECKKNMLNKNNCLKSVVALLKPEEILINK